MRVMNKINKNSFKIVAIFIGVAVATMILIMAGTYLAQRFDKGEPDGGSPEVVEDVVKNDDKTASMEYSGYITINTEENNIKLYFKNPIRSQKDIRIEAIGEVDGEDIKFFETGKIHPGEKIETIEYKSDKKIDTGRYEGKFIVHFYNDQGKEEIVNSEIKINIYVK